MACEEDEAARDEIRIERGRGQPFSFAIQREASSSDTVFFQMRKDGAGWSTNF